MPNPKTVLRVAVAAVAVPGALAAVAAPAASAAELAPAAHTVDSRMADAQHTDLADVQSNKTLSQHTDKLNSNQLSSNHNALNGHDLSLNLPSR